MNAIATKIKGAPARSPERQALAAAIERLDQSAREVDRIETALTSANQKRLPAFQELERAQAAVKEAERNATANLTARLLGDEPVSTLSLRDAKRAVEDAQEQYAGVRAAQDALEVAIGAARSELSMAGMIVSDRVNDVIMVEPAVEKFVAQFEVLSREYARALATANWLTRKIPPRVATMLKHSMQEKSAPDGAWLSAVEALKREADTPLPG